MEKAEYRWIFAEKPLVIPDGRQREKPLLDFAPNEKPCQLTSLAVKRETMTFRDPSDYREASYCDDLPADSLRDNIAELLSRRVSRMDDRLTNLIVAVVTDLLREGRLGALVDVNRLTGRETIARIIAEVIDSPQPRLMACCVDFVFNLGVQTAKNETRIAADFGVTKATVSNYCIHLKHVFLNGKPAPGMKSAEAVESYKVTRTGKTRPPRQPWAFQSTITRTFNR